MRCLVLAEQLLRQGWSCDFFVNSGAVGIVPPIQRQGIRFIELSASQGSSPAALMKSQAAGCDLLVIDHYDLQASYERSLRPWARTLLAIEDLPDREHDCDFLVYPAPWTGKRPNSDANPGDCWILAGPEYALLRPEFRLAREGRGDDREVGRIERIFVNFGLADSRNYTAPTIKGLGAIDVDVDVLIGPATNKRAEIERLCATSGERFSLHIGSDNVSQLMAKADLAIGGGGSTSWERCCLGLPSIVVVMAENQRRTAEVLSAREAAIVIGGGVEFSPDDITRTVGELAVSPQRLAEMSRNSATLCDGLGAARVAAAIFTSTN